MPTNQESSQHGAPNEWRRKGTERVIHENIGTGYMYQPGVMWVRIPAWGGESGGKARESLGAALDGLVGR